MRVLCLHGMGTNASIFRSQTASFRSMLPDHFEFEFFDAEVPCKAADGIGEIYPGPYLCWYGVPAPVEAVTEAHELIRDIIEEEGPFDAVMGFSQGAALASSYILHCQISAPLEPPPFRLAIFICGSLGFSDDERYGVDISPLIANPAIHDPMPGDLEWWRANMVPLNNAATRACGTPTSNPTTRFLAGAEDSSDSETDSNGPSTPGDSGVDVLTDLSALALGPDSKEDEMRQLAVQSIMARNNTLSSSLGLTQMASVESSTCTSIFDGPSSVASIESDLTIPSLGDVLDFSDKSPVRRYHPDHDEIRIAIPTAHIIGKNDPYASQGRQLVRLCESGMVSTYEHPGGHDVPRSRDVSKAIKDAIEATVERSEFMV